MENAEYQPIAGGSVLAHADAQPYHRRWLVADAADNCLLDAQAPALGQLELDLRFGYLQIKAPGMLRLDVPLDVIEDDPSVERTALVGGQAVRTVDEGELASAWFTELLGRPCRLLKVHPDAPAVSWPA